MNTLEVAMTTKRILLIDDETNVREVVQACLNDLAGWDVLPVASGQEGLEQALTVQPDAIVLDVSMPGMDGFAFLAQLRANPLTQSIPVVLLTAKAQWINPQQLRQLGVAEALAKPFNPVTLPQQIALALGWKWG